MISHIPLLTFIPILTDLNQPANYGYETNTRIHGRNMLKIILFLVIWVKSVWKDNAKSLLLVVLAFIIGMLVGWLLVPGYLQKDDSNQIMPNQTIAKNKLYCPNIPDISIPENLKTIDFSSKENIKSFITAVIFKDQDVKRQSQIIRNISVVFEEMKITFFSLTRSS